MKNQILEKQICESGLLHFPMKEEEKENAAVTRWQNKPVKREIKIPVYPLFDSAILRSSGHLGKSRVITSNGEGSIYVEYSTVQQVQNPVGRAYKAPNVRIPLDHLDLTSYNRLSVKIYVEANGSPCTNLTLALHNAGPVVYPIPGRFEGYHTVHAESGKWFREVWEIPHIQRNDVTGFSIEALAVGSPYMNDDKVRVYFDDLRFEEVELDRYKGFSSGNDIIYCHSGYRAEGVKTALVHGNEEKFSLLDENGETVFTGTPITKQDGFIELDFTDFREEGQFALKAGNRISAPFRIEEKGYTSAAWKALNFFFTERCGYDVPGHHLACHKDVFCVHPDGRRRSVAGGWHDAGDLSQFTLNTEECILSMLKLAETSDDPMLSRRALEEARWGIDWLLQIRFGDGYAHTGRFLAFWTENAEGDLDDVLLPAKKIAANNLLAARIFLEASRVWKDSDPAFSRLLFRYAKEDYDCGVEALQDEEFVDANLYVLERYSVAAHTAALLYQDTEEETYKNDAVRFGKVILACQERAVRPEFEKPICGYFYETPEKKRILNYTHRSYEALPIAALGILLEVFPEEKDAAAWKNAVELYGEYLRFMSGLTPYGIIGAGIYETDNGDIVASQYHEGDLSIGAPTLEEYNSQVKNGVHLGGNFYARIFPVAYQYRGFNGTMLGRALAALEAYRVTKDSDLKWMATHQLEWVLGRNPFDSCTMYGEGHNYYPLYSGLNQQIVGAVPVGIQTFENEDIPFWPMQNLPTYKEIYVHSTGLLLWVIGLLNE